MIALFGASGAVGHALAPALEREGLEYRVVGRDTGRLQREFPHAPAMPADFFSGDGVAAAAHGADTIFYLAGAPYTEFYRHPVMVRNALDAAEAAGVERFVHVAPVYSYGTARRLPVPESQPHEPNTRKGRFRLEQDQAVLERHRAGFATVVVHMPDFYGPNADLSYANAFMREALSGKTASWIGPMRAQREFVYVPDVADPLLRLAQIDDAFGRCWNLGGCSVEARTFANEVFNALGKPPKFRSIPKFVLQAVGTVNPFMREVAEMYYLFESGFVLDDSALRQRLGDYAKTPFERGIAQTLMWMRS
jgi:nucleoside-diphosphate-sugar epimerase